MHLSEQTGWDYVRAAFQRIWGYDDFRPPQGEIIHSLLAHQDALVVMPTGGGKSICFQLPALLRTGLTLVVSPLVALMENQVQELHHRDLPAALLHGELPSYQRRQTLLSVQRQHLRLLYLSPETLLSPPVWEVLCQPYIKINGLILDEAHCLVQWGNTFRPAYRRLGAVRSALLTHKLPGTRIAIAAFTATADPQAQQIIQKVLDLKHPDIFRLSPYRPNLNLAVQTTWTPRGRRNQLLKFIQQHPGQSGLVYVRTRRDSDSLATWLAQKGYQTAAYHAGLSPDERRYIETAWLQGELQFVVCTSAFGMGINKPDVRWVIHFHAPVLLSEYVQEVGRAGRDGKPADALTLVSEPTGWLDPEDKQRLNFFQERVRSQQRLAQELVNQLPAKGDVNAIDQQFKQGAIALSLLHSSGQLEWQDPFRYVLTSTKTPQFPQQEQGAQQMLQFLTTPECRWRFLLAAFGFAKESQSMRCGHCDRCLSRP
ncbi:MAG: ATP-dependent DNA helicase RecQ [Oculatellaceae cyanobacterium bins.114]|nr:ATP-dependent DNA helicase RecQ [Oculatellaceae cyanobacterium bins.114]